MIVITAPTGNIGRHLLSLLLESAPAHDEELRVIVRDPARLPDAVRERVEVVTGSHGDAEVVDRAFEGADAVFWLVPPDSSLAPEDAYRGFTRPAAKALAAHGVGHVVGVSALGRGTPVADRAGTRHRVPRHGRPHRRHRRRLPGPGQPVLLREPPGGGRLDPREGRLHRRRRRRPQGPLVAVADIAAVAAGLLLERSWTGSDSVPVLGPQDLSPNDLARIMTEQLGRPVRYERQPLDELYTTLVGHGLNEAFVQGIADMKRAKDEGPRRRRRPHPGHRLPHHLRTVVRPDPQARRPLLKMRHPVTGTHAAHRTGTIRHLGGPRHAR